LFSLIYSERKSTYVLQKGGRQLEGKKEILVWIRNGKNDDCKEEDRFCSRCDVIVKVRRSPESAGKDVYCPGCGVLL
jgi:uncharacterized paraquat-inducible protein A